MTDTKAARVMQLVAEGLSTRYDPDSDDPTVRSGKNHFALLGVPEGTQPRQVPELASRNRAKAHELLEMIESGNADLIDACADLRAKTLEASKRLGTPSDVTTHLRELYAARLAALRAHVEELVHAGVSDPSKGARARAVKLGFSRADIDRAVAEVVGPGGGRAAGGGKSAPPPDRREPPQKRHRPPRVRGRVGAAVLLDFAPIAVGLVLTLYGWGRVNLNDSRVAVDPLTEGKSKPTPAEEKWIRDSFGNRQPVVHDVSFERTGPSSLVARITASDPDKDDIQYEYRVVGDLLDDEPIIVFDGTGYSGVFEGDRDRLAWKSCGPVIEFHEPFPDTIKVRVVDSKGVYSESVVKHVGGRRPMQ